MRNRTAAFQSGLGSLTGPEAYQAFMSPYQQEVIDTTLQSLTETKQFKNTARVTKLFKLELMVVDEKVYWQQSLQEVHLQQVEQIYKHNY